MASVISQEQASSAAQALIKHILYMRQQIPRLLLFLLALMNAVRIFVARDLHQTYSAVHGKICIRQILQKTLNSTMPTIYMYTCIYSCFKDMRPKIWTCPVYLRCNGKEHDHLHDLRAHNAFLLPETFAQCMQS